MGVVNPARTPLLHVCWLASLLLVVFDVKGICCE